MDNRVHPFDSSSFTSEHLLNPPPMGKEDTERFLASLQAKAAEELVATARLWEDRLLVKYHTPFFLVRVADIRAALNSRATALTLYKEVQTVIPTDPVFDTFVAEFDELCKANADNHRTRWSQGIFNQPWYPTSNLRFPIIPMSPERAPFIQTRWEAMNSGSKQLAQMFSRYLCVQTNMLELSFLLTSRSVSQLVRHGFETSAVDFLDDSVLQDRALTVEILRDSYEALQTILRVADDPNQFTVDFLCDIHRICLRTSTILPLKSDDEGHSMLRYLNAGVTRQHSQKNVMIPGPPRVQFCPFDKVDAELSKFTHLARQWLKNWKKNPFATAAWLHLVFAACHPFEDGNGRVARLIASIPLVHAGLPPLCIPATSSVKKAYYEGLHKARDNDYNDLVQCFAQALDISVTIVEGMEP